MGEIQRYIGCHFVQGVDACSIRTLNADFSVGVVCADEVTRDRDGLRACLLRVQLEIAEGQK